MKCLQVRYISVIVVFIFVLNACATVEKPQPLEEDLLDKEAAWELRRVSLETIQVWSLKGRVAGKSNDEGFRAGVRWEQKKHCLLYTSPSPRDRG